MRIIIEAGGNPINIIAIRRTVNPLAETLSPEEILNNNLAVLRKNIPEDFEPEDVFGNAGNELSNAVSMENILKELVMSAVAPTLNLSPVLLFDGEAELDPNKVLDFYAEVNLFYGKPPEQSEQNTGEQTEKEAQPSDTVAEQSETKAETVEKS